MKPPRTLHSLIFRALMFFCLAHVAFLADPASAAVEYLVQSAETTLSSTETLKTVTLGTTVDSSHSFFLLFSTSNQGANSTPSRFVVNGQLLSDGTGLTLRRNASDEIANISYSVIQHPDITVQEGTELMSAGVATFNVPLSPAVDTSKSLVILHRRTAAGSTANHSDSQLTGYLTSSTNLLVQRDTTATAVRFRWQVVTFTDATTIQTGEDTFPDTLTLAGKTLTTPVDPTRSWLYFTVRCNGSGMSYSMVRGRINSSTTLQFERYNANAGVNPTVRWYVVEFPSGQGAAVERNLINTAATTDLVLNGTLTSSIDKTQTFLYHSSRGNGNGTAYARPYWINRFTTCTGDDCSGVQFQRWYNGQHGGIAWEAVTMPSCALAGTPSNPSPADDALGVSVDADLDWDDSPNATSYDVYFGTAADPPLYASDVATSDYTLDPLSGNTHYYWKIVAKNVCGDKIGPVWDFTTCPPAPGLPSNPDPLDDATGVSMDADLNWGDSANATSYDVYFGTDPAPPLHASDVPGSSLTLDPLGCGTHYYWKIVAKNVCGNTPGPVWDFTTETLPPPGTPSTPTPADGATGISIDADLDWADCSNTDTYDVYFGTDPAPPLDGNTAVSSYTLGTLLYNTTYYWKIEAKNGCGTTAGVVWSFTTEPCPIPGTPGTPSPGIGATGVSITAVLDWADCSGTDTYEVYLDTNPTPTTKVGESSISSYDPDLAWDTHYYWKIIAKNDCGNSTEGPVWDFTTGSAPVGDHFVWPGSPSPTDPYSSWDTAAPTIALALNAGEANPKIGTKIVMVRAGTSYSEKVWMKDGVDLVAEEGVSPTITASPGMYNGVVEFTGPMTCNLTGFTIIYTSMGQGIAVDGSSGQVNATIDSCTVRDGNNFGVAIKLKGTVNTTITGCDVYNNPGSMRVGIGGMGWGSGDRIASGSSITIKGTTIGGSGQGLSTDGIRLRGATSASNIQVTIGGSTVGDGNTISYNGRAGILLADIDQFSIENNDISSNGSYGAAGILIVDSSTASPHIKNNSIHHHVNAAGINIGGASNVTIGDNNDIYANKTGISFYVKNNDPLYGGQMDPITKSVSSQPVTITGNNIYSNSYAGIAVRDGVTGAVTITQNNIYSNTRAGIRMQRKCTLNISRNTIRDNLRGGIHTGSDVADGGGFGSTLGTAVLTIEKNKIYNNGQGNMGGGIDVRHASGTIYNNLIYGNHRGGIRFGDYITEIVNNTVVYNGENDFGGGIIYDDLAGAVNDAPDGVPPAPLLILNNISAYNHKAGIRACFDNTEGSEERDYNLLYANYPWNGVFNRWNSEDCGWPDLDDMSCIKQQYGGCVAYFVSGVGIVLDAPNDIVADPMFVSITPGSEDFHLQVGSPAINAGDDNLDMGAFGGSDPIDW